MSSSYNQKNDESTIASDIVNVCMNNDGTTTVKTEIDPYGNVQMSRMSAYGQSHVDGTQVVTLDPQGWGDAESLHQPDLADSVYSTTDMMKHYAGPINTSSRNISLGGRVMNDRERLQLHNQLSWEEASNKDVITVRCRDMTAELYKGRLGSGSKGKCIKMSDSSWLTPSEFEAMAGRGSSKDWKRSIRFGGHTLQKLIEEGILAPHAIACTCSICCGESHLTGGPVRLFTPYKRKRKDGSDVEHSSVKMDSVMSGGPAFSQMDEIANALVAASQQLKLMVDQLRVQYDTFRDASIAQARVQSELEKRDALLNQRNEIINLLRRLLNVDQESVINQIISQINVEPQVNKVTAQSYQVQQVCSNCGRDAYLECTACRRACYCSTYCQQRDWPHHQHQCALVQNSESIVASSTIQAQVDESNDHSQTTRDDHVHQN